MKRMFLFRSNLRILEKYHTIKDVETFEKECHDFYLLMGINFLRKNYIDEFIVWRLKPKNSNIKDIYFEINNRKFIQKFVNSFKECFQYPKPFITLWRGGFKEYDDLTRNNYKFFSNLSLYLGAGKRVLPQYGGKYDFILVEDEKDLNNNYSCLPFFKTANSKIFKNLDLDKKYDICWPCNFSQIKYKGQEFFISIISKSLFLKSLKIIHIGNKPKDGMKLCNKYNVKNINFMDWVDKKNLNKFMNESKFGINLSNIQDGCPRVSTEILSAGIPLLLRDTTRLLKYYKNDNVIIFNDNNIELVIKEAFDNYHLYYNNIKQNDKISMDLICKKNFEIWLEKIT